MQLMTMILCSATCHEHKNKEEKVEKNSKFIDLF